MTVLHVPNGPTFRAECEPIEVTRICRPDTAWRFIDAAGHEHLWHDDTGPASSYRPDRAYRVATTVVVQDPPWYDEDGEEVPQWHLECAECRVLVEPRFRADDTRQFIAGPRFYYIDDRPVGYDEFKAEFERWREAV